MDPVVHILVDAGTPEEGVEIIGVYSTLDAAKAEGERLQRESYDLRRKQWVRLYGTPFPHTYTPTIQWVQYDNVHQARGYSDYEIHEQEIR